MICDTCGESECECFMLDHPCECDACIISHADECPCDRCREIRTESGIARVEAIMEAYA